MFWTFHKSLPEKRKKLYKGTRIYVPLRTLNIHNYYLTLFFSSLKLHNFRASLALLILIKMLCTKIGSSSSVLLQVTTVSTKSFSDSTLAMSWDRLCFSSSLCMICIFTIILTSWAATEKLL